MPGTTTQERAAAAAQSPWAGFTEGLWQNIAVYADAAVTGYQKYVGGITKAFVDTDTNGNILRGVYITKGKVAVG